MRPDLRAFVETLRSLSRVSSRETIREHLLTQRVEDIAEAMPRLETSEAITILQQMAPADAADTLVEMPTETAREIIAELDDATVAHYLDILPMDDALELREILGDDRFDALLQVIPKADAQEVRRLLTYPEDSVGRLMTEAFFEVTPETTMQELLNDIRRSPMDKYEMVNDIYVLNEDRHLLGVFSLRKALRATLKTPARELMNTDVVSAQGSTSAEDAARRMSRYGFYSLPILDSRGRMVGLFTGDDAQAILREADTEDVLKMGAVSGDAEAYMSLSIFKLAWKRLPWLLGLFVAETLTGTVLRHYQAGLDLPTLTLFLPLILGVGGNVGSQVTTMVTRGLALGELTPGDWLSVLGREILTACICGAVLGIAGSARAHFGWNAAPQISLIVGLSLPLIILWAASVGSLLPMAAKRLHIDPAVMSAPFISTLVDATGLIIYFEIALRVFGGNLNSR
ncbi:MAG: magnesium transporter [Armatimonadetes bacterium]|nr:magnesium transporter [Armatimonadota bacterium]